MKSQFIWAFNLLTLPLTTLAHQVSKEPLYITLPPLRSQTTLVNSWRKERLENVPKILKKYNVDAWLISQVCLMSFTWDLPLEAHLQSWLFLEVNEFIRPRYC